MISRCSTASASKSCVETEAANELLFPALAGRILDDDSGRAAKRERDRCAPTAIKRELLAEISS